MALTEHVRTKVQDLSPGDVVRFNGDTAWVTVVQVKADRMGYDMLYAPFNAEPRWRGFDEGDSVTLKRAKALTSEEAAKDVADTLGEVFGA